MPIATRTVERLYDSYDDASNAVRELEASGIPAADISLIANNTDRRVQVPEREENEAAPGAEVGAGVGALAGGTAGVLAGLGMLAIPGVGPVVAAGWLVALAAGAATGAAAGGILGALIGSGISKEHAEIYAEGVRRGGSLVTVRASEDRASMVEAILERNNPVDENTRRDAYAAGGWTSYDPNAPDYTSADIERERSRY